MELPLGVFKLTFFVVFIALTDFIPPNSFLQVFQTTFIFDSGLKFALVLAGSRPYKIFSHNLLFSILQWQNGF